MRVFIALGLMLVIASLVSGCKRPVIKETEKGKQIPNVYSNELRDTANIANLNWKNYFTDSLLTSLIDTALRNNFDLLELTQRIQMSREEIRFARGRMLPEIQATGGTSIRKFGLYTMDGAGNASTNITTGKTIPENLPDYYLGLQSAWEVDVWGKLRNKKRAAVSRYLASQEGRRWVTTNLIAEIANLYYELLALDNEIAIVQKTILLQEYELSIVSLQKNAAHANELAVKQFEAQLLNSKTIEVELKQAIVETENRLNFLLGRFPQPVARNESAFRKSIPNAINTGIPSQLLSNRPDVRQAEQELLASKADLIAARAAFYPSVLITGNGGLQAFNTSFLFTTPESFAYGILGNLSAPLINRSAIKAEFNMAKAAQLEAMYRYQKCILNAFIEVQTQLAGIKNLQIIFDQKQKEVEVLTLSIETSTELFKTGRANYLEVLMTQRNALIANIELLETRKRQYHATINVYKVLGGGWK